MFPPRFSLDSPASRVPPWISRVPPRLPFPRPRDPPRFPQPPRFPVHKLLPGPPTLLPAAARRPSSTPRITTSLPPTPHTPCWWSVASLPGILLFLFFLIFNFSFSRPWTYNYFFPIKTPSGTITRLLSRAACLGLPIGPHHGSNSNNISIINAMHADE